MDKHSPYFGFIDPSSGGFSVSRFGLFLMNVVGAAVSLWLVHKGQGLHAAAIITGIAATDAGVYFKSTGKQYDEQGGEK